MTTLREPLHPEVTRDDMRLRSKEEDGPRRRRAIDSGERLSVVVMVTVIVLCWCACSGLAAGSSDTAVTTSRFANASGVRGAVSRRWDGVPDPLVDRENLRQQSEYPSEFCSIHVTDSSLIRHTPRSLTGRGRGGKAGILTSAVGWGSGCITPVGCIKTEQLICC
jgi:hypothetical protein